MAASTLDGSVECAFVEPDHDLRASHGDVDLEWAEGVGAATQAPRQVVR